MKIIIFVLLLVFSFLAGCSAEQNMAKTILTGDGHSQSWQNDLNELRQKYEIFIGRKTDDLLSELGNPSSIRYNILKKGQTYDEIWNYTFSQGVPFLTQNQKAVWFNIIDGIVVSIDVWL